MALPTIAGLGGSLAANIPARISYSVASRVDSRTILDDSGAEKLIGRADMLFSEGSNLIRLQSPYVANEEIENIITHISVQFNSQQSL